MGPGILAESSTRKDGFSLSPFLAFQLKGQEMAQRRVAHLRGKFLCVGTGSSDRKCTRLPSKEYICVPSGKDAHCLTSF